MAKKPAKLAAVPNPEPEVRAITLEEIVASGASGLYTPFSVHAPLIELGLVEINPDLVNEQGEVATRATQKGIQKMSKVEPIPAISSAFAIEDGVPMPTFAARGRRSNMYPFDALNVGQSFFVPATVEKPNPAKSLASTVSSATARYAVPLEGQFKANKAGEQVPVMAETRKFRVVAVDGGARVWRTA